MPNVKELQALAKELKLKYKGLRKAELIALLEPYQTKEESVPLPPEEATGQAECPACGSRIEFHYNPPLDPLALNLDCPVCGNDNIKLLVAGKTYDV